MQKSIRLLFIAIILVSGFFTTGYFIGETTTMLIAQTSKKIAGNGKVVTNIRELKDFRGISMSGAVNVNVHPGESFKVAVKMDENLQQLILTEVRGDVLYIFQKPNTNVQMPDGAVIDVWLPELQSVATSGACNANIGNCKTAKIRFEISDAGDITTKNLQASEIIAKISGSGDLKINAGKATKMNFEISGAGVVEAENVQIEEITAEISGSGDAKVWATKSLRCEVFGVGNLSYKGTPELDVKTSGIGTVKPL